MISVGDRVVLVDSVSAADAGRRGTVTGMDDLGNFDVRLDPPTGNQIEYGRSVYGYPWLRPLSVVERLAELDRG